MHTCPLTGVNLAVMGISFIIQQKVGAAQAVHPVVSLEWRCTKLNEGHFCMLCQQQNGRKLDRFMLFYSNAAGAAHEPPTPTTVKREPKHEEPQVRRLQIQSYSRST